MRLPTPDAVRCVDWILRMAADGCSRQRPADRGFRVPPFLATVKLMLLADNAGSGCELGWPCRACRREVASLVTTVERAGPSRHSQVVSSHCQQPGLDPR